MLHSIVLGTARHANATSGCRSSNDSFRKQRWDSKRTRRPLRVCLSSPLSCCCCCHFHTAHITSIHPPCLLFLGGSTASLNCTCMLTARMLSYVTEMLRMADDSVTAFPRVWRKDENVATSPNAAVLPEEDMAKPAPTTKKLASYPSHKFQLVRTNSLPPNGPLLAHTLLTTLQYRTFSAEVGYTFMKRRPPLRPCEVMGCLKCAYTQIVSYQLWQFQYPLH